MAGAFNLLERKKWLSQAGSVLAGIIVLVLGHPALGLVAIALGALSLAVTRGASEWYPLSRARKAIAYPGLIIGYAIFGILIIAVGMALRDTSDPS